MDGSHGRPEIFGRPGQAINVAPLQSDILYTLSTYDMAGEHF